MVRETENKYLQRGGQGQVRAAVQGCTGVGSPG